MAETLEFAVEAAEKELPQDVYNFVIVRLAEKALCIAKWWNKLQLKVKYWELSHADGYVRDRETRFLGIGCDWKQMEGLSQLST